MGGGRLVFGLGFATALVVACAHPSAPPPVAPAPAEVAVVAPVAHSAPDLRPLKASADAAVDALAKKLGEIEHACEERWLEPSTVCEPSTFASYAKDYQGYYGEAADPRAETGRIDALPRIGGPSATEDDVMTRAATHCEDRCRVARLGKIDEAVKEAVEKCIAAKTGVAACKAVSKRMTNAGVRATEVERWTDTCEGRCENHRTELRIEAEIDRQRPRTRAASEACKRECERAHGGGWCGTTLLACLGRCTMKSEIARAP